MNLDGTSYYGDETDETHYGANGNGDRLTTHRAPPYSEDAERCVICAAMMGREALATAMETLQPEDFYREAHRKTWHACMALAEKGCVIEFVALADELQRNGELESVGGKNYLATLIDATPTAANIAYHAGIVREYARRRQVIASATVAIMLAYEGRTDAEAIAQSVTAALLPVATDSDVRGFRPIKTIVWETADEIETRSRGESHLHSTGYPSLDAALGGGIERGALVIIGGVQKSGKSAIVHGLTLNAAARGEECAIISAEMGERQVVRRLLSSESGISSATLKTGKLADADWQALTRSMGYVGSLPIWIYDAYGPTLADVRTRVIALKAKRPALTWVVVDYLQLVSNAMKGRRGDEELNGISRGLKSLAKETDTIVVSPVQLLPKIVEERRDKRPELRDVQGFSGAGQDADYVCLTYRPAMYFGDADNRLELILAASRDSAPSTVTLYFHGPMMRIVDTWQPNDA